MTMHAPAFVATHAHSAAAAETALAEFALRHAEALVSAAGHLGDVPAVRRAARLLRDLLDTPPLTRRLRTELIALHRLLSLDGVEDLDSLEAGCFAALDPASPVIEEICLLTDGLRDHLAALAEAEAGNPVWDALTAA
ncbi:hypothetical protein T8T21_16140 (plasmid) [Limimaricola variabilis]|uniref:hypothetical protein n=1 Tax=Limimaricola variabilis TaxID=1492771 RepID=UPI002AC8BAB0|nr:hypothetical protein [Limimaricola variabilis]WPY96303.1 hypothetical protein T8T21_16140 [Limimaricola variabilis]